MHLFLGRILIRFFLVVFFYTTKETKNSTLKCFSLEPTWAPFRHRSLTVCFSLASKMVPACACVCGGRVMAYKVRLHLKNQKRCHPIGYGFERLDSKLGWGRFFFFFFSRRWREGLEGDYLWEAITLNISLKGGRGRLLEGGD